MSPATGAGHPWPGGWRGRWEGIVRENHSLDPGRLQCPVKAEPLKARESRENFFCKITQLRSIRKSNKLGERYCHCRSMLKEATVADGKTLAL